MRPSSLHTRRLVGWARMNAHDDPRRPGTVRRRLRLTMAVEVLHGLPGIL